MLVLPIKPYGDVFALDDDAAPGRMHVALARPRLVKRADGSSSARLVRWTSTERAAGVGQVTGARLSVDIDLQPTAADLQAAGLGGSDARPMPWLDATVRLDGPEFDPIEADVATAAGSAAVLNVDLTPAAAAILAPRLDGRSVSPLQGTWLGHVLVRLPPTEVIATADVNEIRRRLDLVAPNRRLTIVDSIIDANARVEIRGSTNPALETALREWAVAALAERLKTGGSLDVRAAASDVVRWPIQLATTLDDFIPSAARGTLVETIVLDPGDTGHAPPTEVRVLADFTGLLERVDVRLTPIAAEHIVELAFTNDAPRNAALGTTEFRWSSRIKMKGRASDDWSPWQDVHAASALVVPAAAPPNLQIEVLAAALDFTDRWTSVHVVLTHTPPGAAPQPWTADLDAASTSATWTTALPAGRGAIKADLTYVSRQNQTLQRTIDRVQGDQVIVSDPLDGNQLRFTLLPSGTGWSDVALAMVDMEYSDGACVVQETLELRKLTDLVEWIVPARAGGPQVARWRPHVSFTDGRFTSGEWQSAERGPVVVRVDGVARRTVQVLPIYFDPAVSRSVTLRLRSGAEVETLVLSDRTERSVVLSAGPFSWTLHWTRPDGSQSAESDPEDGDDVIVVPRVRG